MTLHIFSQFDYWKECAEEGNTQAQYNLGEIYYHGEGVKQDYSEALKWFRKAAEDGLAKAQFTLGVMYENGLGVDKNDRVALSWYLKAAEQGYTEAIQRCDKLAEHVNVNANIKEYSQLRAYKKKRLAQEQRQKRAEKAYHRGLSYLNGEGVKQNYPEAIKCFEQAASLGHYMAKQKLDKEQQRLKEEQQRKRAEEAYHRGLTYLNGEGAKQDYSAAIKCFEQAVSLGHVKAKQKCREATRKLAEELYRRGLSYLNRGGVQNCLDSIRCFSEVASLGHAEAEQKLAEAEQKLAKAKQTKERQREERTKERAKKLYYRGLRYYRQDRDYAIKFYRKAAQLGYIPAQDELKKLGKTW